MRIVTAFVLLAVRSETSEAIFFDVEGIEDPVGFRRPVGDALRDELQRAHDAGFDGIDVALADGLDRAIAASSN